MAGHAVTVDGHALQVAQTTPAPRDVMLGVRPSDLRIGSSGLPARIERVEDLGDSAIVSLTAGGRPLKIKGRVQHAGSSGDDVFSQLRAAGGPSVRSDRWCPPLNSCFVSKPGMDLT